MNKQLTRLGKGTLTYGLGLMLNRIIGFLLLPLFTSYLAPKDYGINSILMMVSFVLAAVFALGLNAGMAPFYYEGNHEERKCTTIWTTVFLLTISCAVMLGLGIVFARQVSMAAFLTPEYSGLLIFTLIGTALNILSNPFSLRLMYEERARLYMTLTIVSTTLSILLNILFVVGLRMGILGYTISWMLGQGLYLLIFFLATAPAMKFRVDFKLVGPLLKLSAPLIPSFAFMFVLQNGNKYILQVLSGLDVTGIYTIGNSLGLAMYLVVSAFQNAWFPYYMSFIEKQEEARDLFGRVLMYYVYGFGSLSLMFYFFARPVTIIFTNVKFFDAWLVIGLTATAQLLFGVYYILLPGMYFKKEIGYLVPMQFTAAFFAIGVNVMLIPPLGLVGAALALMLGVLIVPVLLHIWNYFRREKYLPVRYKWGRVFQFVLVYAALAGASFWRPFTSLVMEFVYAIVLCLALGGALLLLLKPDEKQMVREYAHQGWGLVKKGMRREKKTGTANSQPASRD